jgi:hypothetical protein
MSNIAKVGQKKIDKTKNAIKSQTKIDESVKIDKLKPKEEDEKKYYCTACGKGYKKQSGNFNVTSSPLYAANNGYVTVCNNCRDTYYKKLVDFFTGNEEKAIDRVCQIFDWHYDDNAVAATRQISANRSRIGAYPSKWNLSQSSERGTTYLDTIRIRNNNAITSVEEAEKLKSDGTLNTSMAAIERWGVGCFSDADYKILDDHYKMLKKQNPNCDSNQEIFIKDLCYTKLQQMNAMKEKRPDDFKTFTQLYRETFKQAGLKTVQETDASNDEVLGVTLAVISQYTPEEYYKDQKLYKDHDGIGDYFKRFILRPILNLMTGSKDRDEEYFVKDGDDDELICR